MPTPVPSDSLRSLATASADRISALLDYYLGNGMLFDALHALSILEGVKAPITLTELASQYTRRIRTAPMVSGQISLHELLLRYAATLAKDQASSYRGYKEAATLAARFLGEDFLAEELTRQDLLGMLDRYAPGASRNGVLIRFRTALRWGVREHLISNQVAEDLRPGPERYKQPAFFKPDRVERIMRLVEEHPGEARASAGMFLALGFFAGVRTVEIERAVWEDVQEDENIVRIPQPKGYTRGVRARVVELEANAVAWLRFWKGEARRAGKVLRGRIVEAPSAFRVWKKTYLEPTGDSWGNDEAHNVMRHTYATMHVGAFRDLKATALNLGHMNNVETLLTHYRGLVSQMVAKTYWDILPREPGTYVVHPEPEHRQGKRTFPRGYIPHLGVFKSKAAERAAKRDARAKAKTLAAATTAAKAAETPAVASAPPPPPTAALEPAPAPEGQPAALLARVPAEPSSEAGSAGVD